MKYLLTLLLLCACSPGQPAVATTAVICGVSEGSAMHQPRTYIRDAHGHISAIFGIWGRRGDSIKVLCRNGTVTMR